MAKAENTTNTQSNTQDNAQNMFNDMMNLFKDSINPMIVNTEVYEQLQKNVQEFVTMNTEVQAGVRELFVAQNKEMLKQYQQHVQSSMDLTKQMMTAQMDMWKSMVKTFQK